MIDNTTPPEAPADIIPFAETAPDLVITLPLAQFEQIVKCIWTQKNIKAVPKRQRPDVQRAIDEVWQNAVLGAAKAKLAAQGKIAQG